MKTSGSSLSADIQVRIEPPSTPLITEELEEQKASNVIRVKIPRNPSQTVSETYKVNVYTFDEVQPEEFLALLRYWKIATDRTGSFHLQARLIIYVHCYVEEVLYDLMN